MYLKREISYAVFLAIIIFGNSSVSANDQGKSGLEIMTLANHRIYYSGGDRTSESRVVVKEKGGTIRTRSTQMIRLDVKPGGEQSYLVYFKGPTDLARTTFLVNKKPGLDDERWLYLPELDIVRRIEAGDKRTHFVGTDFFYEDVSGRHLDDDLHTMVEETKKYWIVRSEPKNTDRVEFSRYQTWVHKQTQLAIKIEYYDKNNRLYRRMSVKKLRKIDDIPTPTKIVLEDLNTGSTTTQTYKVVKYGRGLSSSLFSERSLRNPPMRWLALTSQ